MWRYLLFFILTKGSVSSQSYTTYSLNNYCRSWNKVSFDISATTSSASAVVLRATDGYSYKDNINCSVDLNAPLYHGLIFKFRELDFVDSYSTCPDYIQITNSSMRLTTVMKICNKNSIWYQKVLYFSRGVSLLFHTKKDTDIWRRFGRKGFDVVITSYTTQPCHSYEYRCANSRCISKYLKCDDEDNCGDNSDEWLSACDSGTGYISSSSSLTSGGITAIICVSVAVVAGCICVSICHHIKKSTTSGRVITSTNIRNDRQLHPYQPTDLPPAYNIAVATAAAYPPVNPHFSANNVRTIAPTTYEAVHPQLQRY